MAWNVRHTRPVVSARAKPKKLPELLQKYVGNAEAALAEPFKGITTGGRPIRGLFPIAPTGVSTQPITDAAAAFAAALTPEQRAQASFALDDEAWRRWSNIHPYLMRHGVPLDALTAAQRERALALLAACFSERGYATVRDVMKLNEFIGEVTGRWEEYGQWLYWLSLMGTPSASAPWGWQIDGHHLIVNCVVVGDQVVMTPMFLGSEPVHADAGQHAGIRVFADEEAKGLALMRALSAEQQRKATLGAQLPVELFTAAFRDNFELSYEGVRWDELAGPQRDGLLDLLDVYVGRIRPGHAAVRMEEVRRHLADTWFAWMGSTDDAGVFYYRIHSPVILVEFDHQRGIALDNDQPSRDHIHTVVRTPNGNDYGKDLLRQHYERFDHARGGHA
ncbi:MAG TPA: DUF3500 domain-containing protein [Terriglobales bacterium]|nr:DUF3500 domain-containing protein [Terriglobales bacterium]